MSGERLCFDWLVLFILPEGLVPEEDDFLAGWLIGLNYRPQALAPFLTYDDLTHSLILSRSLRVVLHTAWPGLASLHFNEDQLALFPFGNAHIDTTIG